MNPRSSRSHTIFRVAIDNASIIARIYKSNLPFPKDIKTEREQPDELEE